MKNQALLLHFVTEVCGGVRLIQTTTALLINILGSAVASKVRFKIKISNMLSIHLQ